MLVAVVGENVLRLLADVSELLVVVSEFSCCPLGDVMEGFEVGGGLSRCPSSWEWWFWIRCCGDLVVV